MIFLFIDSFMTFKGTICVIKEKDPNNDFLHYCQEEIVSLESYCSCLVGASITIYLSNEIQATMTELVVEGIWMVYLLLILHII